MAKRAIMLVVVGVGAAVFCACTIESPTYVNEVSATGEGGAPSSSGSSSGSSNTASEGTTESPQDGGAQATCSSTDYIKADLSTLTACGNGAGHCYDKTKVALASELNPCTDPSQVCVPDDILESDGATPKSCTSIIGAGGCVTASLFPQIEAQGASELKQDVCATGQLCVPCDDPTNNNAPTPFCEPIGVHANACSTGGSSASDGGSAEAAAPATALPLCCTTKGVSNGECLPSSAIPASQASSTVQDTCPSGDKCVPTAFVENKPVTCNDSTWGKGVCLDQCFSSGLGFAEDIGFLSQDSCTNTEICVPCSFVSGQGVPSCP